ncbi:rubredoxin [Caenispirillum salinarum]|uniref:rubredoxin n=1 Tax=Caenispirillum salinarum TaxID=859058 RepID=UPI00385083DE
MTADSRLMLAVISRRRLFAVLNVALGALAVSVLPFTRAGRAVAASGGLSGNFPDAKADGKYVCTNPDCDPYVYDPARGDADNINGGGHPVPAGTSFADLPHDWLCPYCGSGKDWFRPLA